MIPTFQGDEMSKIVRSPTRYITDIVFDTADNVFNGALRILGYTFSYGRMIAQEEDRKLKESTKSSR